jgi:hypothetical protein
MLHLWGTDSMLCVEFLNAGYVALLLEVCNCLQLRVLNSGAVMTWAGGKHGDKTLAAAAAAYTFCGNNLHFLFRLSAASLMFTCCCCHHTPQLVCREDARA